MILISSCKKEDELLLNSDENPIDSTFKRDDYFQKPIEEEYGDASIRGVVKDHNSQPLEGVSVYYGNETTKTNSNGEFTLSRLKSNKNNRIWFLKDSYALSQKIVKPLADKVLRVEHSLFPIVQNKTLHLQRDTISNNDYEIIFPDSSFVYKSDNSIVLDSVVASITIYPSENQEFLNAFPGEFKGLNSYGDLENISPYAFLDVTLKAKSNGEPVQLAKGVKAKIKLRTNEIINKDIHVMSYSFEKGTWIEDGIGTFDNGFLTAEVSHFCDWGWFWYWDYRTLFHGRVIEQNGIPVEEAYIKFVSYNNRYIFNGFTEESGTFSFYHYLPTNADIEVYYDIYESKKFNINVQDNYLESYNIGDLQIDIDFSKIQPPTITDDTLYFTIGKEAKIRGKYFGNSKSNDSKVLIDGKEVVDIVNWQTSEITFNLPDNLLEFGEVKVIRGNSESELKYYYEGDWECRIDNNVYNQYTTNINIKYGVKDHLPSCFYNLVNLKVLTVDYFAGIISIDDNIKNLKNLVYFDVSGNKINHISENFWELKKLRELRLSHNKLTSISSNISKLKKLEILHIGGENHTFESLPESIGELESLKRLSIHKGKLKKLPNSLGNLTNLQYLVVNYIDNDGYTSLPNTLVNLNKLERLNVSHSSIEELPEGISNMTSLIGIDAESSKLKTLPTDFGYLPNLAQLELEDNELEYLPESFGYLSKLSMIDMDNNKLKSLPESIRNMSSLNTIHINNNELESLPESIGDLNNLGGILASNNKIKTIPESMTKMTGLIRLNLSNNLIEKIPNNFNKSFKVFYKGSSIIDLSYNKIKVVPSDFLNGCSLEILDLSNNEIESIPGEFFSNISVWKINLSNNNLDSIPPEIGNLRGVIEINLENNNLTTLPDKLFEVTSRNNIMIKLLLAGNQFSEKEKKRLEKLTKGNISIQYK